MAVVTDGLFRYWNAKDGIKSGSVLSNLAPDQSNQNLTVSGGSVLGNGAIFLDGVDDYISFLATGAPYETYNIPYSIEFLFTPRSLSGSREILDWGTYFEKQSDALYVEYAGNSNSSDTLLTLNNFTGISTAEPLLITVTHNGSRAMRVYRNGTLFDSRTAVSDPAMSAKGYTTMSFCRGVFSTALSADFHAMRVYTKELTAAEVSQNWSNGIDIGIGAPLIKAGEFRAQTGDRIPVYDIEGHESEPFRFRLENKTVFIPLVSVTDPSASRVRLQTPAGVRAWKK